MSILNVALFTTQFYKYFAAPEKKMQRIKFVGDFL